MLAMVWGLLGALLQASRILLTVVSGGSHSQVNTNGPRVIVDAGNGVGPTGGFITRYIYEIVGSCSPWSLVAMVK